MKPKTIKIEKQPVCIGRGLPNNTDNCEQPTPKKSYKGNFFTAIKLK